jgi:hypothetical protein
MTKKEDQTILDVFKEFPACFFNYGFGMVLAILSDFTLISAALGSFFLGCATTVWVGLAAFFLLHTGIKMVNALNGAIVQGGRLAAEGSVSGGARIAQVFDDQAAAASKPSFDPPSEP